MHVKHVSSVTFYHLSNRCLPNVMKINVKINIMQPTFCFRSFTVLNILKECLIAVWSDFWQVTIDFADDQWRKRLQACVRANGGHFEHRLWTNSRKRLAFFMCFWFKWLLSIVSAFYCVDAWWSIGRPTVINCKALSLLRTVNKQKSKMLIFCMVLIFALILTTFGISFICGIDDEKAHLKPFTRMRIANFWFLSFPR